MDRNHLEICANTSHVSFSEDQASFVSLESEIPEVLYNALNTFVSMNNNWDQYRVMSSALAYFLYQNGCTDRAVTERYLDDLFVNAQSISEQPSNRLQTA
ncbi:hypothetical protein SynBIOSE41_02690 [Synechococcus sp. BIOS-E4-1]|uniref:DUF2811 domain-containing protein n=1 Tax=Synechococcus sp. BIOS-E4-1 TaxID=1400864 RepID=UPI001645B900|nr:DUF2811 domain-containing protein [Synechococcus sp. BIOS-E4-1]QNI55181.1 hypothetical protein SynBIOSE41_02690 [Synechococcus sp. BIOS-E4-1]